jgi:sugar phosphate isomerase/epimerase
MDRMEIGAQLYTLRDYLQTPADIIKTLRKVKDIGFEIVQASKMEDIKPIELKKILDDEGLKCVHTHEPALDILENTEKVIEKLNILDCKHTAYPSPHKEFKTEADWLGLAEGLNRSGAKLKEAGQTLSYHNHAVEFQRFGNRVALDILYNETDPENLAAEIDTYWVQYGGNNPVKWCEKVKNRMPAIHLKDYGIIGDEVKTVEVGYGNLDMEAIIKAARICGTEYFLIEQDECQVCPFESLKMSLEYLLKLEI